MFTFFIKAGKCCNWEAKHHVYFRLSKQPKALLLIMTRERLILASYGFESQKHICTLPSREYVDGGEIKKRRSRKETAVASHSVLWEQRPLCSKSPQPSSHPPPFQGSLSKWESGRQAPLQDWCRDSGRSLGQATRSKPPERPISLLCPEKTSHPLSLNQYVLQALKESTHWRTKQKDKKEIMIALNGWI